jgi:amidase
MITIKLRRQRLVGRFHFFLIYLIASFACIFFIGSYVYASEKDKETVSSSNDLVFLSAGELAEKIRSHQVTSLEVVNAYLDHIKKYNHTLNAIVTLDEDEAIRRAKEADAALARGELWGPLHGVPITIKDNVATRGLKTTNSYTLTANYVPDFDATVVARLRKAGAIILGKTNLPSLGMDYQTNSPVFGITNNPWDVSRTPGGSTGGGAAAVAAGLTSLEIGNDIGGSIRIPSHFCGIYGLKPTEHLVPITGISPGLPKNEYRSMRHLLSLGPLARSIDDLKLCLTIIAGPDETDVDVPYIPLSELRKKDLKDIRIAWTDDFGGVPVSEDTKVALKQFTDKLSKAGCTVEKINPADFDFMSAWQTYGKIMDMELGIYTPSYARFLEYILGWSYRKDSPMLQLVYPMSYEKYLMALTKREDFISTMERFLSGYDVFLCPVHTTAAYKHIPPDRYFGPYPLYSKDFMIDDKPLTYMVANGAYTTIFNLTGNPVVVMPVGYTKEGLPIGVQVVGQRWHDMELLTVSGQLDKIAGAYKHPPGF